MSVPIRGDIGDLAAFTEACDAHQAILAMSSAGPEVVASAAEAAERAGIALKILPDMKRRMGAGVSIRDMRDVSIDDLLGRTEVATDLDAVHRLLRGRRVLITGAGGSIGAEIARQVAACGPAELLLLDHDETHLHDVSMTLEVPHQQVLADIRSHDRIQRVFQAHRPQIVFHAAALKHVPLLETNPCEATATNVIGTRNVLDAAKAFGVERFVFVSTDKAVEPSSVMGATKRVGEELVRSMAPTNAPWCAVRFGNVLGSRGSVIPTFMRQIAAGGPVTVTDPRMTRYFMSIEEAVQLVLQATVLAEGGDVFVLDMGKPVRIVELARKMIELSGHEPGRDIAIEFVGIRPGEKLHEELFNVDEDVRGTRYGKIRRATRPALDPQRLALGIEQLEMLVADGEATPVTTALWAALDPGSGRRDSGPGRHDTGERPLPASEPAGPS
jgi:FlaA1/EpsC-like NDP-sugar epimerase